MRRGRALKGNVSWLLQIATVVVAFAVTMGVVGTLIYSVEQTQREVDSAVNAYRLAAALNILRTVDGGHAEREFATPLTIRLEGRRVVITDAGGKERGLEYLVGADQGAVGGRDSAHAVESGRARGTGPVPVSALEEAVVLSNQASANTQELFGVARYVQEQCGRGIPAGIGLRVQDLETGKMWSAGYAADAKKRDQ